MGRGDYYLLNRAGNSTGLAATYTGITNAGNDGYIQLGPGLESLDLTGLPVGANVMRTTYQGIDFLGRPFRLYDSQLTQRLQVDSTGAAVTGVLGVSGNTTLSGKAVVTDSLRVGRITTLNGGLTVQGAGVTFNNPLSFSTTAGNGISFNGATSGASITNAADAKLQLGGRNNSTTLVLNGSGSSDVVVNGDLDATDSLTTRALVVDAGATITGNSWVAGRWIVGDSLRVNKVANFDAGAKVTGASWVSGTVDVGDTLRAANGARVVNGLDVSSGNLSIRFGNGYQIRNSAQVAKSILSANASDDLIITPLGATGRVTLKGTAGTVGVSTDSNGDVFVGSGLSVSDSCTVGGPLVASHSALVTDSLRVNKGLYAGANYLEKLDAGTYSPTRSAELNMDANVTMTTATYMRVGSTVTVSGRFTADPTAAATFSGFSFTLPVASNFSAAEDAAGVGFCGVIAGMGAQITGDSTNDIAVVRWTSSDVASQTWTYTFTYTIK